MIQRIQSIYLIAAFLLTALASIFTWVNYQVNQAIYQFNPLDFDAEIHATELLPLLVLGLVLSVVVLFSFKNRTVQMRLARAGAVLSFLQFVVFGVLHYLNISVLSQLGSTTMNYTIVVFFPVINFVLFLLAFKRIKKDDDLVKSIDRLR